MIFSQQSPKTIFWLFIGLLIVILSACASYNFNPEPMATSEFLSELEYIDDIMKQTTKGNISYNTPSEMILDETIKLQLLISPSIPTSELEQLITKSGEITSGEINITSRMKVELKPAPENAFLIETVHDSPEQILTTIEPTEWKWLITAKEEGTHTLILSVYRLIEFQEEKYWRCVKSYEDIIKVKVTFSQRLKQIDWKWGIGILVTALIIPAFWRWVDNRLKKKKKDTEV